MLPRWWVHGAVSAPLAASYCRSQVASCRRMVVAGLCLRHNSTMTLRILTGFRFGKLTVGDRAPPLPGGKSRNARWVCICDCGAETVVSGNHLQKKDTVSCGCHRIQATRSRSTTHKHSVGSGCTNTYYSWCSMKARCSNPNDDSFKFYGARGIKVCERWASFENFLQDMGVRQDGTTLDRIDPNLDYMPNNCRWATTKEQQNNRRRHHWITFSGETRTISEWADVVGISPKTIATRLYRGWTAERALTTPPAIGSRIVSKHPAQHRIV